MKSKLPVRMKKVKIQLCMTNPLNSSFLPEIFSVFSDYYSVSAVEFIEYYGYEALASRNLVANYV